MKIFTVLLCLLGCALPGCGESDGRLLVSAPPVGSVCTVCIRRDALGAPTSRLLEPSTINVDGTDIAFSGKLVAADHEWIALDTQPEANKGVPLRVWLPRETVLAIYQRR